MVQLVKGNVVSQKKPTNFQHWRMIKGMSS